ncbi:MAG: hypothetical protein U0570_00775 [Phycisphaerales bacterium]
MEKVHAFLPSRSRSDRFGGRTFATLLAAIAPVLGWSGSLEAAGYTIDWMSWAPWGINNSGGPPVTSPQNLFLNGVGNVNVTFTQPAPALSAYRFQSPTFLSGSVSSGGDTYSWTNHEGLARTNFDAGGSSRSWSVTFTFSNMVAADHLVLGVFGLGRLDLAYPNSITKASVAQNGKFLGDWGVGGNLGPTDFSSSPGNFSLQNLLPGDTTPGNPAFNTALGVVLIQDQVTSLTVNIDQIGQDGIGLNIGYIPAPGAAALLACGGVLMTRRRR